MEIDMGWISTTGERLPDIEVITDIRESLGRVDGVTNVEVIESGYDVHTTYSGSREGRKRVYDGQRRLMDRYPDVLFDFHVISL